MNLIKGIHHVSLKCVGSEEYERVVDFYNTVLELPIIRTWTGGTMLDTGNGIIEIFDSGVDHPGQGVIRHFALETDSVDACIEKVRAAGCEVFVEPKNVDMQTDPVYRIRVAFCYGLLGEEIEFFEIR